MVKLERRWIPKERGCSLYVRPTMIATEPGLGVRSSNRYLFFAILSPVSYYFPQGFKPISLAVTKSLVRAVPGGTGEAKCGGNYAATLLAGKVAKDLGYSQVLWTDGVEHKYLEEVGAMNFFICYGKTIVTPELERFHPAGHHAHVRGRAGPAPRIRGGGTQDQPPGGLGGHRQRQADRGLRQRDRRRHSLPWGPSGTTARSATSTTTRWARSPATSTTSC